MLTTIIGTAIGFVIATIIMSIVAFALMANQRFMTWYMNRIMRNTMEVMENMEEF